MNKIKKEFLGKHVLGAPESAMQVLSMWLIKTSRKVVSVSTSMKDECVSLPKSKSQLAQLHDEDEDVFATSIIDRYAARPYALHNVCLATFAVKHDLIQSSTKTAETHNINTEEDMNNTENSDIVTKWKLQKGLGVIRKRKSRQYYGQEDTKSIQNLKHTIMQSFSYITQGMKKMTYYQHTKVTMTHT